MQNHILQLTLLSLVLIRVSLWALSLSQPPNLKVSTIVGKGDEGKLEGSFPISQGVKKFTFRLPIMLKL